ncbi:MAG: RHS repeat protein [Nitrospira sp.]|nr:RHS repeat protein [Nitrospira sp.]
MKPSVSLGAKVLVLLLHSGVGFTSLCQVYADQSQYLYDEQARLVGVSDSTGSTVIYNYDAVGNLLSIDRLTPPGSGIGIYLVNPIAGPVTVLCRVQGYGFDQWSDRTKEAGSIG